MKVRPVWEGHDAWGAQLRVYVEHDDGGLVVRRASRSGEGRWQAGPRVVVPFEALTSVVAALTREAP